MKLLRYDELPDSEGSVYFRNRSWLSIFWTAMLMAAIAVFVVIPKDGPSNAHFAWMPALFAGFLLLLAAERVRICTKRRAWLLRMSEEGLYVNLRSFHNYHLPPESHRILFIPAEEVAAVCRTQETMMVPNRRGAHRDRYTYIDLLLKHEELGPLREALRQERRLDAPPGRFTRRKRDDYSVRVLEPGGVRLIWDWIRPNESNALDILGKSYPLAPDRKVTVRTKWEKMSEQERESLILQLWEWGFVEDALRLGKMHWSLGDHRARKKLDELVAGN